MSGRVYGLVLRGLACALLCWLVGLVWHVSTYDASTVEWFCDNEGCASDQFASMAPLLGVGAGVLFGLLSARFLRRATAGVTVTVAALGAARGWYDAIDAGRVDRATATDYMIVFPFGTYAVSAWLTFFWCVAGAGLVAALWGGWVSARRAAVLRRVSRKYATADALLEGWRATGRGRGEVTAVFHDADGTRHEVPAVVDRAALGRPVLAVYDTSRPGDPGRVRVAVPRRRTPRSR
ncbi:hypothetical protein ABII15_32625 [Streptomyces sp. HUAS MG91]|uniref:Protoporphyrinogen oxidase n=1 Tax=Streptomyces tabacisoli TaxID=3156398 RepID=A0AAU8J120_9ACTN